ncbi:iron-containing alcohol dehydrogenase [candidate division NPL-UPA2 bacterium]|nr:iron-containing alcohol dehydrogenase [candidate division NPL-UPA2 bacterium]
MPENLFTFRVAPKIIFGNGAVEKVGEEAKKWGGSKALLISDEGIAKAGLLKRVEEPLAKEGLEVAIFDRVEPEPWVETADEAGEMARKKNCDLIIGVGGGSCMDIAKAAAVLATNEDKAKDYQGLNKVPKPGLPKIMVPTTAGTGSEITFTSVLSNKEPKGKGGINSPYLFPELALLDPLLTLSMPSLITASTGMDALTHAIEAYTSLQATAITDTLALKAVTLLARNLPQAVAESQNVEVRENMLLGSLLAGIVLANAGVGAVHALAYPLGGLYRIPHGVANGLMLPYVMEFNLEKSLEKFAQVARAMGEEVESLSLREAAQRSVEAVTKLSEEVSVPQKIKKLEAGIREKDFPQMAAAAMKVTRPLENNPRLMTEGEAIKIYEQAY